jgi:hypothetical protein
VDDDGFAHQAGLTGMSDGKRHGAELGFEPIQLARRQFDFGVEPIEHLPKRPAVSGMGWVLQFGPSDEEPSYELKFGPILQIELLIQIEHTIDGFTKPLVQAVEPGNVF